MKPIANWNSIQPADFSERPSEFEPGAYVCRIVNVECTNSSTGRPMLVFYLDIAEGEHAGFFAADFNRQKERGKNSFWKLKHYQLTDRNAVYFFKRLINNIEASNAGYKFNWDEKTLIGKLLGVMIDGEEGKTLNGFKFMKFKPNKTFNVSVIREGKAGEPEILGLDGKPKAKDEFEHVDDADIPF